MAGMTARRRTGRSDRLDRIFDLDLAGLFEFEGRLDVLTLLQRLRLQPTKSRKREGLRCESSICSKSKGELYNVNLGSNGRRVHRRSGSGMAGQTIAGARATSLRKLLKPAELVAGTVIKFP